MPSPHSTHPSIGIDFGTTNSSVALALPGGAVELVSFPASTTTTESFRSVLYLEQHKQAGRTQVKSFTGPAGIEQYLVAEHKGRLIQSLKSYLSSRSLTGTEVFGKRYTVEDLISRILTDLRLHAERQFGQPIRHATVGRPVRFVGADKTDDDDFALGRLREAFLHSGFERVDFEMEPIGAAYAYESTLDHDELILIGDFGGGTSDFSLVHVGPGVRARGRTAKDLVGNSGLGLAGDTFDARIVRKLVSPALGADSLARSLNKLLPAVPAWIYANLERWHYLSFLKTRNVSQILKIALSHEETARFYFRDGSMNIQSMVTREEFESWISDELQSIEQCVDGLLTTSGVAAGEIDRVFLTGGTSFVPAVRRIFETRFTAARVRMGNEFTSVARGLALRAQERESPGLKPLSRFKGLSQG